MKWIIYGLLILMAGYLVFDKVIYPIVIKSTSKEGIDTTLTPIRWIRGNDLVIVESVAIKVDSSGVVHYIIPQQQPQADSTGRVKLDSLKNPIMVQVFPVLDPKLFIEELPYKINLKR